jgi:chromosome partitioning protein
MTTPSPVLPGTTIVAANEKGGVGKTFITVALAVMLACHLRLRVLLVDMDPQANASHSVGVARKRVQNSIFDTLRDPETSPIHSVIRRTCIDTHTQSFFDPNDPQFQVSPESLEYGPDLAPINEKAITAISDLQQGMLWALRLRNALEPIKHHYDYILVDTNPLINSFIALGLCAADYVLIPVVPEELPTQGLIGLSRLVREAQLPQLNPTLNVAGIFFNSVEEWASHTSYINEIRNELAQKGLRYSCLQTRIERFPAIATASKDRSVVTLRFPYNQASKSLWSLLQELVMITGGRARERVPMYLQRLSQEEARLKEERRQKQAERQERKQMMTLHKTRLQKEGQ